MLRSLPSFTPVYLGGSPDVRHDHLLSLLTLAPENHTRQYQYFYEKLFDCACSEMWIQPRFDWSEFIASDAAIRRMMSKHRTALYDIKTPLELTAAGTRAAALSALWYRLFFDYPPHIKNTRLVYLVIPYLDNTFEFRVVR